jgi:hypothetical protein
MAALAAAQGTFAAGARSVAKIVPYSFW